MIHYKKCHVKMKSICMSNFFHPSLKTFDKTQERYYHIYEKSCRLKVGWYFFCAKVERVQEIKEGSCNVKEEISYNTLKTFLCFMWHWSIFYGMFFPSFGKCDFVPICGQTSEKETWYRPQQTSILNRRRTTPKTKVDLSYLGVKCLNDVIYFNFPNLFLQKLFHKIEQKNLGMQQASKRRPFSR